jgi:hypothetical protein
VGTGKSVLTFVSIITVSSPILIIIHSATVIDDILLNHRSPGGATSFFFANMMTFVPFSEKHTRESRQAVHFKHLLAEQCRAESFYTTYLTQKRWELSSGPSLTSQERTSSMDLMNAINLTEK